MDEPKKHARPLTLRLRESPELSAQMKSLQILFLNEHGECAVVLFGPFSWFSQADAVFGDVSDQTRFCGIVRQGIGFQ